MAVTCRDIATRALRKLGVIRAGAEPKAADAADALASLQSYYMECVTGGAFGRVVNIPLSTAGTVTAGGNQHINVLVDDTVTVDLPSTLPTYHWDTWEPCRDYGWGLNVPFGGTDGDNVPPDKSVVMVTDKFTPATRAVYVYDGTVQLWMRVDTLTDNDEAPLSARNSDGLSALLAFRLADEFGDGSLSALTIQAANRYKLAMVMSYGTGECGSYTLGAY